MNTFGNWHFIKMSLGFLLNGISTFEGYLIPKPSLYKKKKKKKE